MEEVASAFDSGTFNGTLETGLRAVMVLRKAYPKSMDIHRLTAMDYLLVRTSMLDGPPDLHPATPIMSPVTQVRRESVLNGLAMMMSRQLVSQEVTDSGIKYIAGDYCAFFVDSFQSVYLQQLIDRAEWLVGYFKDYSDLEFENLMKEMLDNWVAEFQDEIKKTGETE